MLVLAFPQGSAGVLGWVALVPLLCAIRGRGFLVGLASAMLSMLASPGALYSARSQIGSPHWIFLSYGFLLLTVGGVTAAWGSVRDPNPVLIAAMAVLMEWLASPLLPVPMALTQPRFLPIAEMAAPTKTCVFRSTSQ